VNFYPAHRPVALNVLLRCCTSCGMGRFAKYSAMRLLFNCCLQRFHKFTLWGLYTR